MPEPVQEEENDFEGKFFNALLVVLIIVMAFLSVNALLNRQPERYSEVYLDPNKTTEVIGFGQELEVIFFIKNVEGKTMDYNYSITAEGQKKASGSVSLKNGELKKVTESIVFSQPYPEKQKVLIEVSKKEKKEPYTLWFWVKVS